MKVANLQVIAGTFIYSNPNQISKVKSIRTPDYFEPKNTVGQDIVVLTLDAPFDLVNPCRVRPVKLPERNYRPPGKYNIE